MYTFKDCNPLWVRDVIHYMCEFRIWTKSDEELFDMFVSMDIGDFNV